MWLTMARVIPFHGIWEPTHRSSEHLALRCCTPVCGTGTSKKCPYFRFETGFEHEGFVSRSFHLHKFSELDSSTPSFSFFLLSPSCFTVFSARYDISQP
ncbi:hypothetical protein VNO77_40711 [Canavalia gladiata]|uniref:Uncharacterized protein n=1 Tax=Canavalia gladiata TaxID=3824 RepID=A0AAN9K081_CANGL